MKNQALSSSQFCIKISKVQNSPTTLEETREAQAAFPDSKQCARGVCQTEIPGCKFLKEALFCSDGLKLVFHLLLFGPVHTMRLASYDSFVLLC